MLEKFLKYWSDFCTILTITVIFYPRYKLQFVEWAYKKVYGENSNELKKKNRENLFSLFKEYILFQLNLPVCLPCKVLFLTQVRMMIEKVKENYIHILRLVLFIFLIATYSCLLYSYILFLIHFMFVELFFF